MINSVYLTNSMEQRYSMEKLTVSQLVKKFPTFYGTRRFITAFTRARHVSLSKNCPGSRLCTLFRRLIIFYGEELLAPCPTPKLENHPLSAVCDCLFNVFAATLHNWRPFFHPQPEDAQCRGDRDPHNTYIVWIKSALILWIIRNVYTGKTRSF
jgi:hypothetical protein